MFLYFVPLMNTSAYSLNDNIGNSSQIGILVTLGLLLFIVGTLLRRSLPLAEDATTPQAINPDFKQQQLSTYVGSKPVAATAAATARHANAVNA